MAKREEEIYRWYVFFWSILVLLMLGNIKMNTDKIGKIQTEDGTWVEPIYFTDFPYDTTSDTLPCDTDQDCMEKNPDAEGLYAFPEKR